MPLILLDEPEEDWLSLFCSELSLPFFFDLLFEVLSLAWSLEDELPVPLEDVLGTDEDELPLIDELPFDVVSVDELGVDDELELGLLEVDEELLGMDELELLLGLELPDVDAAPLFCDEELDDGLCVLPLL
jgi:hypothetical protein